MKNIANDDDQPQISEECFRKAKRERKQRGQARPYLTRGLKM